MDDLPDKLRRNVVVLSTAIVAITVFHLSFQPSGTLLGFAKVGNVTPVKVWLALTTVLIYVFLRYWFDEQTDKERRLLAQEFDGRRYSSIRRHLQRTVERYLIHRRSPHSLVDFDESAGEQLAHITHRGRVTRAKATVGIDRDRFSEWRGEARFSFELQWASGDRFEGSFARPYRFQLPRHLVAWQAVRCALSTASYSKSAVDTLVPIGMATIAFGMCVFQLFMAGVKA